MTGRYARWLAERERRKSTRETIKAIDEAIKRTISAYHENRISIYFGEKCFYTWLCLREDPSYYGRYYLNKGFNVKLFSDHIVIDWSGAND